MITVGVSSLAAGWEGHKGGAAGHRRGGANALFCQLSAGGEDRGTVQCSGAPAPIAVSIMTFSGLLPLFMALDVASTSTECDYLRGELNTKRRQDMSPEADAKIQVVERLLTLTNRSQGLGVAEGGRVLDQRTLQLFFVSICGLVGAVLPIVFLR